MSKIRNTSKDDIHPEWLMGGNPRAIEDQEARGQEELVNSTQLPVNCIGKDKLEEAGVIFGEPLEDDPLFCEAHLPEGWKKEATDHSMWSKLVDAEGNERARIFYKAAFYDRDAFVRVTLFKEATSDRTAIRLNWQLKHQFEELLKHYNKRLQSRDLNKEAIKDYAECAETLKDILSRADAS